VITRKSRIVLAPCVVALRESLTSLSLLKHGGRWRWRSSTRPPANGKLSFKSCWSNHYHPSTVPYIPFYCCLPD
jgi:hypothetical protein